MTKLLNRTTAAVWHDRHGRWQINVQKDGIRKSFYSSQKDDAGRRECQAKADAWLDGNIEGANTEVSKMFEKFIAEKEASTSASNVLKIKSIYKIWIEPNIGDLKIINVEEQNLQKILDMAFQKKLAEKSLENIKFVLCTFIKFCRKRKTTTLYPESLKIPENASKRESRILLPEDLCKLFLSDKTLYRDKEVEDEYINAYRFQVVTGLRPGELMALRWADIENDTVYVKNSKNYLNEFTTGKGDNAKRKFVLTRLAKIVLTCQPDDTEFVFGDMNLSTYSKRWKIYCDHNNISYVSLYELRHTFVSIAQKLPDEKRRLILGYSENRTAYDEYSQEINGDREKAALEIDAIFANLLKNVL